MAFSLSDMPTIDAKFVQGFREFTRRAFEELRTSAPDAATHPGHDDCRSTKSAPGLAAPPNDNQPRLLGLPPGY